MRFLVSLDVGRGIAATWVMLFHFNFMLSQYTPDPSFGILALSHTPVLFFFALSGFLMMTLQQKHFGQSAMWTKFLFRRLGRIFPMYWLALLLMSVIVVFSKSLSLPTASDMLKQFLLLTPTTDGNGYARILGVAWTLEVEILFYLSFSLLLFLKTRWLQALWFVLVLAVALTHSPNVLLFLAGMLAAVFIEKVPKTALNSLWPTAIFIGMALWVEIQDFSPLFAKGGAAIACWGIIVTLVLWERTRPQLATQCPRWLQLNGHCSYSCYLFHIPIGTIILKILHASGALALLNGTVALLILSASTWYITILIGQYVETPMNAWIKRYSNRKWGALVKHY